MKDNPSYQEIRDALKDGYFDSADVDTLRICQRRILELQHWKIPLTERVFLTPEVEQTLLVLRHLIDQKTSAEDQRKTLFWAKIAGVASVAAVVLAVIPIWQSCASGPDIPSHRAASLPAPTAQPPPALVSPTNYTAISTNKPKMP